MWGSQVFALGSLCDGSRHGIDDRPEFGVAQISLCCGSQEDYV